MGKMISASLAVKDFVDSITNKVKKASNVRNSTTRTSWPGETPKLYRRVVIPVLHYTSSTNLMLEKLDNKIESFTAASLGRCLGAPDPPQIMSPLL